MACSPTAMYELIDCLDKKQKDEIASYNLGGLLQIPNVQIRRKACMEVADSYSVEDDAFIINDTKIRMVLKDVVHILDLPDEGETPDVKAKHKDEKVEAQRRKKQHELFNNYKDTTGSITFKGLVEQINENKGSTDEHFVRRFLLCAICRHMCPATKATVSSDYLKLMLDVNDIKQVNWARHGEH